MSKKYYLFHFIVSGRINNFINYLKKSLNFKKNSALIDYIINIMTNYISKMKKIIRDQRSEYEFIDTEDSTRIHKYVRMKSNKYKILKKWHFVFNEYGMSGILRDFIVFFYNGIVKYGEAKFLEIISKKMNYDKIIKRIKILATHMNDYFLENRILYSYIVEDLLFFSQ